MNSELAYYVVRYIPMMGRDDIYAQCEATREPHFSKWLTDDSEALKLAANGLQEFRARTATRILAEHDNEVSLNYCPSCHKLARTPQARQCRFCGHDWHCGR